ncbi:hypothetical protein ScPMuIL_001186 [Solemya velum]
MANTGTGQRAFARKINKQRAADVRQQVTSAVYNPHDLSKCASRLSLVPLCDVVDPPDFEDFVIQNQCTVERDPFRDLILYPEDDVEVHSVPRKCRTVTPVVPEAGAECDPHVFDCVRRYTCDYMTVRRKYQHYGSTLSSKDRLMERENLYQQEYEIDVEETLSEQEKDQLIKRQSVNINDTPRGSWASSIFDLKQSQADSILPNLFDQVKVEDVDYNNRQQRQQNRQNTIFSLYPSQQEDGITERRPLPPIPEEHFGHRILVKCLQLKLELDVEPLFATMALYDAKDKKKISENFHFDLNSDSLRKMISMHMPYQDTTMLSKSCIFSLTYPSPDVYLVVKVKKVLQQGDISECSEPYMKDDKSKEDRYRSNAVQFCEKLGKYRMPFAWTAIHLMNVVTGANSLERGEVEKSDCDTSRTASLDRRSGLPAGQFDSMRSKRMSRDDSITGSRSSLDRGRPGYEKRRSWSPDDYGTSLDNFRPFTLTVSSLFKQESDKLSDEDLYKFLADLKRPTSLLKRVKCIPCTLKLDISPSPEEPKYTVTPELWKVEPYPDDKKTPTKEILEFPTHEVYNPHTVYRNLMFVYPKYLNFANRQGPARNIAVKIRFMFGEEANHALPVIFGKSGCPEFSREAYTSVTYHTKSPSFHEEVKIRLPARLTEDHHLLFTFYHISCQNKKGESRPTELPIGYTWCPLYRDGRIFVGEFNLPVSIDPLPPRYSTFFPDIQLPGMKWVDNHRGVFTVTLQVESSIHIQDDRLDSFLNLCRMGQEQKLPARKNETQYENELKYNLNDLLNAKGDNLVKFYPLILDKLISLMVRPPAFGISVLNIGQPAFEALARIIHQLQELLGDKNDHNGRNSVLSSYIHYCCSLPHPGLIHQCTEPNLLSPSGYNTLGRPSSLSVIKQSYQRSNSNPDLAGSTPTSPDAEVATLIANKFLDRSGSMKGDEYNMFQQPNYHKIRGKKLVHEELALQWIVLSGTTREIALSNAWFFFELMIKSMAEHLEKVDRLDVPRQERFPDHFMDDVNSLVGTLIRDIVDRYFKDYALIQSLNTSLSFFIHDLLSFMDRGFVFQLIKNYWRCVSEKISLLTDGTTLMQLRLDFLRIICSHEHFYPLNLPFGTPLTPSGGASSPTLSVTSINSQASYTSTSTLTEKGMYYELTMEFRQQHFLVGLMLSDLTTALETSNPSIHHKAINVVRNLLTNHDLDVRYTDPEMKARLASLYLPLIGIVIDAFPQLYDPYLDGRYRNSMNWEGEEGDKINQDVAMAIAGTSVFAGRSYEGHFDSHDNSKSKKCMINGEATRHLLICLVWVLKNADRSVLHHWWSEFPLERLHQLLDVIYLIISNFEYRGKKSFVQYSQQTLKKSVDMKSKLEEAILGTGNARSEMMMRRKQTAIYNFGSGSGDKTPPAGGYEGSHLRWRRDQLHWRPSLETLESSKPRDIETDAYIEGNLAAEVSLVALDTLDLIIEIAQGLDIMPSVLSGALRVLLHSLRLNQSTWVLQSMFSSQRSLVTKFLDLLFEEETEQCADLCLRLLRHCSSCIANTRSQASASLYMLMRQNFELGNNFARVKMQVTMSLSSLVGQNQNFNEEYLRKSLKTILIYADADVDLRKTTFPEQVKDLVFKLHMILTDTVKMKEHQEDPEMLLDLMYRIAKGYQSNPDLRLTWLQNMANKHSESGKNAEAAHCLVHAAGLIAEYLNMLEDKPYLPVGCVDFQKITPNVLEESAVSDDVVSPDEEGNYTEKYFSEHGLVGLLEQSASSFTMGGMFEAVNHVYKILLPIHEAHRDYKKLAHIYGKLQEAFNSAIRQEGKRLFGTYFRVGFYGQMFGDLDGEEFIYKEPAITKLPEISHRLEHFYSERFGSELVVMIKDSNTVEKDTLNPDKAYIQITYVEPFFESYELKNRVTYFEKNYNIKRFMYATPFTLDGRAHGELQDQYKRKTILTTSHTFPYVKTRLSVVDREQVLPLTSCIRDLFLKLTRVKFIGIAYRPLQLNHGRTQTPGPVEVAIVFLKDVFEGHQQPTKYHNKLRLCFKDFLKKSKDCLHKNKSLITPEQKEYQRELERKYNHIKDKLVPMISSNVGTIRKKHKNREGKEARSKKQSSPNSSFA